MNKNHRVIWNAVRNCFVVTSENVKSKGQSSSTTITVSVSAAIAAIFITPSIALAIPCSGQTSVSSALATQQCYIDQAVTISSVGSITTSGQSAVYVSASPYTQAFLNNGSLIANALISDSAIQFSGDVAGNITNNGVIKANASNSNTATAYGVRIDGNLSGSIINNGQINVNAVSINDTAFAYGIAVNSNVEASGSIVNNGTISLDVLANTDPTAYGIYVGGDVNGSIVNKGTISIKEVSTYSDLYAYGIYVGNNLNGNITNSGTINMTLNPESYVYTGAGIYVDGSLASTGSINNSGSIIINANAVGYENSDYGIYVGDDIAGNVTNSGSISITATSRERVYTYGIYSNNVSGNVLNSGNITLSSTGTTSPSSAGAYGIYTDNLDGVITNSGSITVTSSNPSQAYSIYVYNGTGTINNLASGVLNGQVYASGAVNVNNDGIINTYLNGSYVGGNYTQGAGGALTISAVDTSNYGSLFASGTANLAAGSGINVAVDPSSTLVAGDTLTDVVAGSVSLTASTVNVGDNNLALNFTPFITGNSIDLTAVATGLTTVTAAVQGAGLKSAVGAAGVLDALLTDAANQPGALGSFLFDLGSQSTQQGVANKASEILPLVSGAVAQATLNSMRDSNRVVQERISGMSSGNPTITDQHFWFKPFGSYADQNKRSGTSGYSARSYGAVFGLDGELSELTRLGMAFTYSQSKIDGDSFAHQNADVDSYQGTLYGSYKLGPATFIDSQVDYGVHKNEGHRRIVGVGTARSDYDSTSLHAGVGLAQSINIDQVTNFTPSIRADYTWVDNDSYTEEGVGALDLNVRSKITEELILAVDGKFDRTISDKAKLFANLGAGYDVINDRASITSAFAGAPTQAFTTNGVDPSPWLLRGGLGIEGKVSETVEVTARYDFEVRNDFSNQTASVKARWAF